MTHVSAASQRAAAPLEHRPRVHVQSPEQATSTPSPAEQATAISRLVVQATSAYTGRGPTRVHTVLDEQAITVLLYESMSRGEHNLLRDGVERPLLEMRHAALRSVGRRICGQIAETAGRPVTAVLAAQHGAPDVASLTFVLEDARAEHAIEG